VRNRPLVLPFLIIVVVAVADQLTKLWVVRYLAEGGRTQFWGQFFQLKLVYNRGGALGTELGGSYFYLVTSLLILGLVIYFIIANKNVPLITVPLSFIAGGAIGNIIDRIRLGHVTDFLDFDFFDFDIFGLHVERWWTFNLADSAITVGVIALLIYIIFLSKSPGPDQNETTEINP
jgi:signal peptidase II